ncbi:MAG TPA: sulfotransferase, partial [Pirellulales bacterium]|nr:sulfotransferase [Pirellulales bacterium]
KCGTTSLYDLLAQHPQIGMSTVKEPAFFCDDEIFARGFSWYESLFAHAVDRQAVGEASTSYTKKYSYPHAAERIARHLPEARLIYVARHPLERIESQWMHGVHAGWHASNFSRALDDPGLIDPSRYWRQIQAYRKSFPDDRILVLFFDDFKTDPLGVVSRCCEFLGVDRSFVPSDPDQARNASASLESEARLLAALRRIPLSRRLAHIFPESWRADLKRQFFTRRTGGRPTWPADKRRRVIWEIGDDVRCFLEFYGRPADFWNFES